VIGVSFTTPQTSFSANNRKLLSLSLIFRDIKRRDHGRRII
jgi:hypothetical protein